MNQITPYNSIQFQGHKLSIDKRKYIQHKAARALNQSFQDVAKLSEDASGKKMYFLDKLIEKYNQFNFYSNSKENPQIVNDIFQTINKPRNIHFDIAERFGESFADMARIFKSSQNNTKHLKFAKLVNDDIFNTEHDKSKSVIPSLLESPHIDKYIKKYKDIKPYLIINKNNPDAVADLDKLFETKSFDKDFFKAKMNEEKIKKEFNYNGTKTLNSDVYFSIYNKQSHKLWQTLKQTTSLTDNLLSHGGDELILKALQTVRKDNIKIRQELATQFATPYSSQASENRFQSLASLVRIFNKIDNDKHAKNFVKKSIGNMTEEFSAQELEDLLNNIPAKQLNTFRKNAWNIINQTQPDERINILKENIKNPFYKTKFKALNDQRAIAYGFKKKESFFKKMIIRIANSFNILKDKFNTYDTPIIETYKKPIETNDIITNKATAKMEPIVSDLQAAKPDAKQIVAKNVLDFITPKLGNKTFSKQETLYTKNATKMRLSMLPEIFSSIADTRKADRAVGKKRINSANKDVLDLYLKINGSNKKFVNYLLKKRNVDNTRMFEVKDIIAMLDKAEAKIAKEKKLNPNYRAKDARQYYNHLYEAKIEQYGKVKPQRKLKTNA